MDKRNLPQTSGLNSRIDQVFRRVSLLEKNAVRLTTDLGAALKSIGEDLRTLSESVASIEERLAAAIAVVGVGEVRAEFQAARARREVEAQAKLLDAVQKQVADGRLKPAEKIVDAERGKDGVPLTAGAVFVGVEYDDADVVVPPGKIVLRMSDLAAEFTAPLIGAAAGTDVSVPRKQSDGSDAVGPDGKPLRSRIRILEVYEVVPPKASAAKAEPAAG